MKLIMKRVLSFLIALSMVVGLIPGMSMTAQAADVNGTLSDSSIVLAYEEPTAGADISWQATDTAISGSLKGAYVGKKYLSDSSILTIKNNKRAEAVLSFKYKVTTSSGNVYLGDTILSGSGGKEITIAKDGSVQIKLEVRRASSETKAEIDITDIFLLANVEATTKFEVAENGTYTVNTSTDLVGQTNTQMSNIAYELSATPNEGYEFLGWYSVDEGKYVAYEANVAYKSDINRTIVPKFVPLSTPIFQVGTVKFADLGEAANYAKANNADKIILISDGKISGNYTIPAGVTLLIPFNDNNTCYTTEPLSTGIFTNSEGKKRPNPWEEPYPYRTLEMTEGSVINVEGAISVSAKHSSGPQNTAGSPSGPCGFIKMENKSEIIVKDGGALYAWGYVVGEGTVTTKSGGTVYENMQITDFRGGSATLAIGGSYGETHPFFPFSQYYVQNIEVKSTLESGAEEYLVTSLFAQEMVLSAPVLFIGGSDAMFELKEGAKISKEYIAEKDRLEVHVEGDAAINSMSVELKGIAEINSANFILPINSNIDIYVDSGTSESNQNLVFLPGSSFHVAENAVVNVYEKLTFFDADDYKKGYVGSFDQNDDGDYELNVTDREVAGYFVYPSSRLVPIKYTYENAYTRTEDDIIDVTFDVNGFVNADMPIYTTMGGANITSTNGTGVIVFPYGAYEEDLDGYTFQYNQGSGVELICIPITSALLKNTDGTYTETLGAEEEDVFGWSKSNAKWQKITDVKVVLHSNNMIGDEEEITISKEDIIAGEKIELTTLEELGYSRDGYTFLGWSTDKNAKEAEYADGAEVLFTEDTTLYAVWKAEKFEITYNLDGGFISDDFATTQLYEMGAAVTQPGEPTKEGYTFDAWVDADGNKVTIPETMPAENISVKATYTVKTYEITLDNNGADIPVYSPYVVPYGASLTEGDYKLPEPGKTGYTFTGWKFADGSDAPAEMPAYEFTLIATWAKKAYDFIYEVDGETTTKTVEFGDKLPLPADPEKEGHTFARWTDGGKVYTKDSTMPAEPLYVTAEWTKNSYPVTFKDSLSDVVYSTVDVEFDSAITEPETPTKTGYTFAGWDVEVPAKMPAKELTFKAQWDVNQYTITFDTDGGSAVASITQDYNSAVTAPAAPTKTGYTFAGWDVEVPAKMPAENVTLKAQWTINQYTITFDTDGGSAVASITQDYNSAVTAPAAPTKTGYTFDGWTPAVPEIMPAENTTVKAQWKVKQYTITFNTDGGSEVAPITAEFGAAVAVPANPTKPGYVFAGWDVPVPEIMPAENLTINANWIVKTGIVIEFNTKGGTAVGPITGSYGDKITAPAAPTKEGYTFKGWSPELPATMPADKLVVEAQWQVNEYTITFDTDGGNTIDAITADFGTPVTAPTAPTKVGHTFVGWDVEIPSTMPAGDMTIKAIWNVKNYKLTFNSNGGSEVEAIEAAYNTKVDAPAAPTKEKYTFVCWLDEKGKEVTFPVTMPEEGMILTAKWRYSYTGWDTDDNGKTYYNDGAIAYKDTLATIDGDTYFFDENGYVVTGLVKLTDPEVKGGCLYYYFQEDGKALKNDSLWIDVTDGILPRYEYEFNENGEIVHDEDTTKMGIVKEDGVKYYYVYGVKAYKGVFLNEEDGEYYYVSSSGKLVVNRNYWISRVDGIDFSEKITSVKVGDVEFVEKSYTFDEEGRIVLPKEEKKNGIVAEDGSLFYYVNGVRTYAGLIQDEEGNYYYVRTSGELARNRNYYTTKHNGLLKAATYNFDENGKMTNPPSKEVKNGIIEENGGFYYYKDGKLTYAGLIEIDGSYYYVRTSGQLVTGRSYWITKHNDLKPEGSYEFAEDGKMIIAEEVKDGIVEENGGLYYYKDGKLTYAGLIQDEEGNYYYVRTSGQLVVGRKYWITKTNDLLPEKSYTFNELGQIVSN